MKQETDEECTGLQKIVDKVADFFYFVDDFLKTEIPSPQFIQRYIEEYKIRSNIHKRLLRYDAQERILDYLDNRTFIEKLKGFVPFSNEYSKQSAAEEILLEKLRGM